MGYFNSWEKVRVSPFSFWKVFPAINTSLNFFDAHNGSCCSEVIVRKVYNSKIYKSVSQKLGTFHGRLVDYFDMRAGKCFMKAL